MAPKSIFWKFFRKTDKKRAKCKLCSKDIKTSGNTSNLKCHIQSIHSKIYDEFVEKK